MLDLQPVKGTRDFFPNEMKPRNWLFSIWRETSKQFGFEEYDACILEKEDLYIRKAGDEITDQLYSFSDKSGRRVSLRPEMTPSLARMVLQNQKSLSFPLKWFSIAQCFRYERMTKGRRREHFQWNADVVGQPLEVAEAEILMMILTACQKMGFTSQQLRIFLNDRRILNHILSDAGIPPEQQTRLLIVMDKRDKLEPSLFKDLLLLEGLSESQIIKIQEFLLISSFEQLEKSLSHSKVLEPIQNLMALLEDANMGSFIQYDGSIIRGLSYYTGTVFEMNLLTKSQRAICGGGRYDSLLASYGGSPIPAVGFGFGDVVIMDVLEEQHLLPNLTEAVDYWVVPFSQKEAGIALKISHHLRNQGFQVHSHFGFKKMKKTLQQADEAQVENVILIFPDELEKGQVLIRQMSTRQENSVSLESVMQLKKRRLCSPAYRKDPCEMECCRSEHGCSISLRPRKQNMGQT